MVSSARLLRSPGRAVLRDFLTWLSEIAVPKVPGAFPTDLV